MLMMSMRVKTGVASLEIRMESFHSITSNLPYDLAWHTIPWHIAKRTQHLMPLTLVQQCT